MSDQQLTTKSKTDIASVIESVVIGGDLSKLTPEQRVAYYRSVCSSLGLNPLTRPFEYIVLKGKLVLYARKDATEQLRHNHKISIDKPEIQFQDDWIIVTVSAHDVDGRMDSDIGVVSKKDMQGDFGNSLMKAMTKAKRRVTLSICGLGMLDETEVETIPDAKQVIVGETGEIVPPAQPGNGHKEPEQPTEKQPTIDPKIQALIDAKVSPDVADAAGVLNKIKGDKLSVTDAVARGKVYRSWRDKGSSPAQAAEKAITGEQPS